MTQNQLLPRKIRERLFIEMTKAQVKLKQILSRVLA